ncbi:DUF309 domain-containing protein [Thalassoroseus pseudoceratinae]|uniref:DUF309 domain-containing protein n=1 Tax=Thalassoroseus pseudoceratinae TaxID=2713176 RepID=UPI00141EAC01|nr:DUF309 domain-containing protein [Thalassoroseus pseudoceratinae]
MIPNAPEQYLHGIRLFNAEEFFECHDVLEELWTDIVGPERDFYQGLIQAAVALFHLTEGNWGGARRLSRSCLRYLTPYRPAYLGLDLDRFFTDFEACFAELNSAGPDWPTDLECRAELIPELHELPDPNQPSDIR